MRLAKTRWTAIAAALFVSLTAPSYASVTLTYPGFNIYFGSDVTVDISSGTVATTSGLTGDYGGYQYHYDMTTVSGISYTAQNVAGRGGASPSYTLRWIADDGWQLNSFSNVTTGLVTGASSAQPSGIVFVTGTHSTGTDSVSMSPISGQQASSWVESYNNTVVSDPTQEGWVGTNWATVPRFWGNGWDPVVLSNIQGTTSFTAYRFYDPIPTAAVPEPETWAMLGMGLVGVVAAKRRRNPQSTRA